MKSIFNKIKLHIFFLTLNDFLKLVRLQNLIILVFTQYCARIFLISDTKKLIDTIFEPEIFFLALCTVLIASAGYIINDYYDIKIDMVNKPNRVVLNKHISRRLALFFHLLLNFIAISLAYLTLSLNVAIFIFACGFLLWFYSNYLKRTAFWGNLCIGFLAFATLFLLGLYYKNDMRLILLFALNAFFITIAREILKDMEDIRGDILHGCHTLPINIGIKKTKNVVYIIVSTNILLLIIAHVFINFWLSVYFLIFTIIPLLIVCYKLWYAQRIMDFHRLSTWIKILMIIGVMGMVLTKF